MAVTSDEAISPPRLQGSRAGNAYQPPRIAIIGAGFSGLCLAIQLKKLGIDSFTIYEKSEHLGGTWRDNTYPGAACDVPSFAYCYSFEQKDDWTRVWASQSEILAYMEHCAEKYRILPHIHFGAEIENARFDAERALWQLRSADGAATEAEILVSGVGQLHKPLFPDIPGRSSFEGKSFHSARWDHSVSLAGKRVGVIGNAASAVQLVPEIAKEVASLTVFQRSANWIMPRGDRAYTKDELARFRRDPWRVRLHRFLIWARLEARWPVFRGNATFRRIYQKPAIAAMNAIVQDPELRAKLLPDYPMGGKRILIADGYYETLMQDHVALETSPIECITPEGVATEDGVVHPFDFLIYATGFDTNSFLEPMKIEGTEGRTLATEWKDGAEAYLGLTVSGFPNLFLMYGPNTNLGHNSIIFMIECQARYILDCLRQMREEGIAWIDVRRDVMDDFHRAIHRELDQTVWARTDRSWYKTKAGRITNNWSGTTARYWWKTRRADLADYTRAPRQP